MEDVDTLIHARWVIPVEPHGAVWEDHSVAVRGGRIEAILPRAEAEARYRAERVTELPEHAVIPGLINAHTHAAMTLMRGLADDLPLMEWLQRHIWPAEARWISAEMVHDGSQLAVAEMLRGGVTCFNDMYFHPDVAARAASQAGMRAVVGLIVLDFPTPWAADAEEYLHRGLEVHDQVRGNPLVTTAFAPHAPYTVSDAPLERVAMYAEELDVPIHIHVHETRDEVNQGLEQHDKRPLARMDALGLVSPRLVAVHFTQVAEGEIDLLADRGAHVVHCPESNMKLASGFCPTVELRRAGVNVALGTDGAASNNDLDLIGETRTAALLAKAVADDAAALPAADALRMATLNGASALGLDSELGSLEPGKAADLVAVDLGDIEGCPHYHPVSHLVYATTRDKVSDVWVAGRHVLKERHLTTLDEAALRAQAQQWQGRIADSDARAQEADHG
ncbi:MAG TPA: TRZ/ATZ family hydrolase [Gammaproteobacteria bacterium]|nr:TRZ/ATZ family hydrolase [Gammaproteobacteria bacterium]